MKTYSVVFEPGAQAEAWVAADYIYQFSPKASDKWFAGLARAINPLEHVPSRCGPARESETIGGDLRQLIYQSYRIIFRIERTRPSFAFSTFDTRHNGPSARPN